MDLLVFTDASLRAAGSVPLKWDVTGSVPLCAPKALTALGHLLNRDRMHDCVIFRAHPTTGEPVRDAPLDPSLTAYQQGLAKGAAVFVTTNPDALFSDPSRAFWVPLVTAGLRFGVDMVSRHVRVVGSNRRRVVKAGPDSWESSVAVCDTALSNEGTSRWTFRITSQQLLAAEAARQQQRRTAAADGSKGSRGQHEAALGDTMYGNVSVGGAESNSNTNNNRAKRTAVNHRTVRFAEAHADRHDDDADDDAYGDAGDGDESSGSAEEDEDAAEDAEPGHIAPSLPDEFEGATSWPIVAIGVADENVPLGATRVHASYKRAYMLHTTTGAFYTAGDPRPLFADGHTFRCVPGMLVTLALNTERGTLNVLFNGRSVLTAPVAMHVALYPVVELFSHGAIVDLM